MNSLQSPGSPGSPDTYISDNDFFRYHRRSLSNRSDTSFDSTDSKADSAYDSADDLELLEPTHSPNLKRGAQKTLQRSLLEGEMRSMSISSSSSSSSASKSRRGQKRRQQFDMQPPLSKKLDLIIKLHTPSQTLKFATYSSVNIDDLYKHIQQSFSLPAPVTADGEFHLQFLSDPESSKSCMVDLCDQEDFDYLVSSCSARANTALVLHLYNLPESHRLKPQINSKLLSRSATSANASAGAGFGVIHEEDEIADMLSSY